MGLAWSQRPGMGGEKLLDSIFNLKFTSKQLVKSSIKCEKDEKAEKLKVMRPWRCLVARRRVSCLGFLPLKL